ncbi:adenosylmethionine decarboxylase [Synchytrium microbalum]|uniref:adenosylmethionine decarboxylase n=1 Tax=Synchytrium microbalum TaxID=1806994 RepID=A0A507CE25_9FUNG|nr:adenosylmethionine decarboxylase [Synchytrium microbalum]TPX37731.1 adenosylmethionine decarboxylase [Synchytrium microbalum]
MTPVMAVPDVTPQTTTVASATNINHHIYSTHKTLTAPPFLPDKPPPTGITLCGFEGPEKLLEIWFSAPSRSESPDSGLGSGPPSPRQSVSTIYEENWYIETGLRVVPKHVWDDMLAIVKAQVLSSVHNEYADAYLLSESSMFIYPRKLILKTCGTTTLLHAVPRILDIAREYCGFHHVDHIFYSRKAFLFPDKQVWPHGKWGDEVVYLDYLFPSSQYNTAGYVVGKVNGDHWCCYLASPITQSDCDENPEPIPPSWSDSDSEKDSEEKVDSFQDDLTLEIMMTGIDKDAAKVFWRNNNEVEDDKSGNAEQRVYNETGLADIYPTSKVDHHVFDPCGYSLNGLMGPYYWTVHVTPEEHCSYASFETSAPVRRFYPDAASAHTSEGHDVYNTFEDVISRVVTSFQPAQFCVSLFTRKSISMQHKRNVLQGRIPGFDRRDCIRHESGKWQVQYAKYEARKDEKIL